MLRMGWRNKFGIISVLVLNIVLLSFIVSSIASAEVKLELWDGQQSRLTLTQTFVDQYMKENPGVTITLTPVAALDEKFAVALAAGAPPDIVQLHNAWAPRFEKNLAPYPKDLFPRATLNKRYIAFEATAMLNGEVYWLPLGIMNGAVYYNTNMLQNAGISRPAGDWAGFLRQARQLTRLRGDGTMEMAGFQFLGNFMWMWTDVLYQYGGTLFNPKGGVTFASEPSRNAFNTLLELKEANIDQSGNDLAKGTAAMRYSWTHFETAAQKMGFEYGVAMIPTPTGKSLPARGRSNVEIGLGVPAQISGEKQREAFRFIKWLYDNDEFVVQLSSILGAVPSRQDVWNHPLVTSNKSMQMLVQQAPYTVFPGPVDNWYWTMLGEASNRLLAGEGITAVLDDVQRRGDAKFKEVPILSMEGAYAPPR